ncbi:MAG: hypothetical protein JXQ99_00440 [Hyphomicrobiaceae bacterium]
MGFLTDPKTGKRMNADQFIQREKKEWGDAFKTFGKELLQAGDKSGRSFLGSLDKDLAEIIQDHRKRKRRR